MLYQNVFGTKTVFIFQKLQNSHEIVKINQIKVNVLIFQNYKYVLLLNSSVDICINRFLYSRMKVDCMKMNTHFFPWFDFSNF